MDPVIADMIVQSVKDICLAVCFCFILWALFR
jgi:hypothetical protein